MTDELIAWLQPNYNRIAHKVSYTHIPYGKETKKSTFHGYQVIVNLNGEDMPPFKSYIAVNNHFGFRHNLAYEYSKSGRAIRKNGNKIKIRTEAIEK